MARASRHPPMISRGDGPPGATGAPVTGGPGTLAELDDPVVPGVGHPDLPGRGDRQALRELQVLGRPARVRLQAELGVEAPGRAEHGHQPVVRLRDVDPAARPDRDAARVAEVTVARLGDAERAQLMPGRGVLADRVAPGQGVAGAGHPDVAAGVQRDAGRRRHGERDAVAADGGELHHPAVALVGDPDVAEGRDRERHRLVQLAAAAPGRAEGGQHPAGRGELHHPVVAGVRHPDVPGRVGGDAGRLVQVLAEGGQHPPGGGELHHPVMAGVRHPDVARPDRRPRRRAAPAPAARAPAGTAARAPAGPAGVRRRPGSRAGQRGRPGRSGTATSMAASTLPHARAITRGRRPRHRDFRPIDQQSNPFRPVPQSALGRLGHRLDDQVNGPPDHALLLRHPEAGPGPAGRWPGTGLPRHPPARHVARVRSGHAPSRGGVTAPVADRAPFSRPVPACIRFRLPDPGLARALRRCQISDDLRRRRKEPRLAATSPSLGRQEPGHAQVHPDLAPDSWRGAGSLSVTTTTCQRRCSRLSCSALTVPRNRPMLAHLDRTNCLECSVCPLASTGRLPLRAVPSDEQNLVEPLMRVRSGSSM